jgi:hypothetical protein
VPSQCSQVKHQSGGFRLTQTLPLIPACIQSSPAISNEKSPDLLEAGRPTRQMSKSSYEPHVSTTMTRNTRTHYTTSPQQTTCWTSARHFVLQDMQYLANHNSKRYFVPHSPNPAETPRRKIYRRILTKSSPELFKEVAADHQSIFQGNLE